MKQAAKKKTKGITIKADRAPRSPRSPRYVDRTFARRKAQREEHRLEDKSVARGTVRGVDANTVVPVGGRWRSRTGGTVLPGENAAKTATPDDVRRAASVLVAAAYRLHQNVDGTTLAPPFDAFGKGRAVTLSVGVNVEADGTASVKLSGEVDGRKFEV